MRNQISLIRKNGKIQTRKNLKGGEGKWSQRWSEIKHQWNKPWADKKSKLRTKLQELRNRFRRKKPETIPLQTTQEPPTPALEPETPLTVHKPYVEGITPSPSRTNNSNKSPQYTEEELEAFRNNVNFYTEEIEKKKKDKAAYIKEPTQSSSNQASTSTTLYAYNYSNLEIELEKAQKALNNRERVVDEKLAAYSNAMEELAENVKSTQTVYKSHFQNSNVVNKALTSKQSEVNEKLAAYNKATRELEKEVIIFNEAQKFHNEMKGKKDAEIKASNQAVAQKKKDQTIEEFDAQIKFLEGELRKAEKQLREAEGQSEYSTAGGSRKRKMRKSKGKNFRNTRRNTRRSTRRNTRRRTIKRMARKARK